MKVLGIDPGFSSLGWAVCEVSGNNVNALKCGVFRTEKDTKKTNTRSSEDNIRRARLIHEYLSLLIVDNSIKLICTETMSWPRNAGVVAKMGIAWGCIASASERHNISIIQAAPMILKRAVTGNGKASKEDMIAAIKAMFPNLELPKQETLQEHAADAVGSVIACSDSELMRFANGF